MSSVIAMYFGLPVWAQVMIVAAYATIVTEVYDRVMTFVYFKMQLRMLTPIIGLAYMYVLANPVLSGSVGKSQFITFTYVATMGLYFFVVVFPRVERKNEERRKTSEQKGS